MLNHCCPNRPSEAIAADRMIFQSKSLSRTRAASFRARSSVNFKHRGQPHFFAQWLKELT